MKKGVRILALDDGMFTRKDSSAAIIGIIGREGVIEGVISFSVDVDGDDATEKLITRIENSRFKDQIKLIAINGISFAGMNIIDLGKVNRSLGVSIIAITRKQPRRSLLKKAIRTAGKAVASKTKLIDSITRIVKISKINGMYVQCIGISESDAKQHFEKSIELLRLAHLVASGVSRGESSGRI